MRPGEYDAPPVIEDDPGPGDDHYHETEAPVGRPVEVRDDADARVTTDRLARWLGLQAARMGVLRPGRELIHPSVIAVYEAGGALPADSKLTHGLTDGERSRWVRELRRVGGQVPETSAPELPAVIAKLVQRHDIGTGTRYDMTLRADGKDYVLRDLLAVDLLSWERIRPIACDAGLVLPALKKGGGDLWTAEVKRAMEVREVRLMVPEESETVDMRHRMMEMAMAARRWEYSEDDPRPIGLALIERDTLIGWPREPMKNELRARIGRLSRVALPRAVSSLGWVAREWRYPGGSVHVWCCFKERWAAVIADPRNIP